MSLPNQKLQWLGGYAGQREQELGQRMTKLDLWRRSSSGDRPYSTYDKNGTLYQILVED
jgi:hypothetical protein